MTHTSLVRREREKPKAKAVQAWGGFCDGILDWTTNDAGWGGFGTGDFVMRPALFKTQKAARAKYQDVRRVEIREMSASDAYQKKEKP